MPVSISCEQQCNSDVQVNRKRSKEATHHSVKAFLRTKKENRKFRHQNSEANLFRIRKKYFSKSSPVEQAGQVLKENNRGNFVAVKPKTTDDNSANVISQENPNSGIRKHHPTPSNVSLKSHNKRKIYNVIAESLSEEENNDLSTEKCKLQKLAASKATTTRCGEAYNMYEYRHQSANVSKNEGDSDFLTKNDAAEENLINAFYQQQCLGGSNNSIATLCNIGNSCYLNSVIYTLRFAPHFLHKLHHLVEDMRQVYQKIGQYKMKSSSLGRNVSGVQNYNGRSWSSKDLVSLNGVSSNGVDPVLKNNRQIATEKLHELYQSLHRNESIDSIESFHAGTFLQAIQDVSSIFEGNQQQDAHELLMCILDSIRETCSTLIKTIRENPEIMNQNVHAAETNELTSPPQSNLHSAQSLKSIFSRKIRRKDTLKNNGGTSSPIKENIVDNVLDEEPSVESKTNNEAPVIVDNSDKVNEAIKRLGLDFFCKDFEGITLFTTKCLTCETVTEQKETMVDIAIPMSHDSLAQPIDPQLFFQVFSGLYSNLSASSL